MLEIYMEAVADLLVKGSGPKGGLKVRQNPKLGKFFVQGLSKVPVSTYKEIDARMEEGTSNRTVAATQMNATSSRAHTVVTLEYQQIITGEDGKKTTRTSEINLVDLAGSERANSTGACNKQHVAVWVWGVGGRMCMFSLSLSLFLRCVRACVRVSGWDVSGVLPRQCRCANTAAVWMSANAHAGVCRLLLQAPLAIASRKAPRLISP